MLKPLLAILLFISTCALAAQENNYQCEIIFEGFKKTKESHIKRLISSDDENNLSKDQVEKDLQIIKNIPSIKNASYKLDTVNNKITLTFKVEERITFLPSLNLGGIKDNFWFSAGFIENNFQGKGDQLLAYYQNNDRRHSAQIYYSKNNFKGGPYGYSLSLNKWSSLEPLFFENGTVNYLYDNDSFAATLKRALGKLDQIEIGATYFIENYRQAEDQFLENPPGPQTLRQRKALFKLKLKRDKLNYEGVHLFGHEVFFIYQKVHSFDDSSNFNSLLFQGRFFFRPHDKINLATRFRFGISTNNDSPFAPFVADSHVNIRGIGNRIDRGTAQAIFNAEIRYSIFNKNNWASQVVAFSDSGTWRNPGGSLSDLLSESQFRQFLGGGIRISYQNVFGAILRIDYGIDIYNPEQKGIVVGLGQYF